MMIMKPYLDIVQYRQSLEQTNILERSGNSGLVDINRFLSYDILSIQCNDSFCRFIYSGKKVKYRRFSGPIRSDQPIQAPFFNFHMKFIYRAKTAKGDSEILHFQ